MKSIHARDRRTPRRLAWEIATLCACGAWLPAAAQSAGAERSLPVVTVEEGALRDDPSTARVDADALAAGQARDLREIFASEPGVAVGGGSSPIAQKVYVRGFEENQLNVSYDGARQNGWVYHHQGRNIVDPQILKSVEVSKGTPDATAGPGALTGAIRYTTKDAADLLRPGQRFGALIDGGASSNDGWHSSLALYGRSGALDFLAYGAHQDLDDYEDGNGDRVRTTATEADNGLFKLGFEIAPGQRLSLGYSGLREEGDRYLRPNFRALAADETIYPSEFKRDTTTLGWSAAADGARPAIELKVYYDDNENLRTNESSGRTYGESIVSSGADLALESRLGRHTLRYGYNYAQQDNAAINPVRRYNAAFINGADNSGEEESSVHGVYLQDTLALSAQWLLSLGGRYDWFDYTDNHGQNYDSNGFSPNASLTFQATEALALRLSAAHTQRGVGPKETFLLDNGPGPNTYRNDAELDEEKADNVELALDYNSRDWSLRAAVFRQRIENYINYDFFGPGQARRFNAGDVENRGYELAGEYRYASWQLSASVAESEPELEGEPLSDLNFGLGTTVGRTWRLGLDYTGAGGRLRGGWAVRYVESQDARDVNDVAYTKDSYTVHDLQASWQPLGDDSLSLRFAIKNLFDKFYYDQATYALNTNVPGAYLGLPEAGRDLRLDLSYKF